MSIVENFVHRAPADTREALRLAAVGHLVPLDTLRHRVNQHLQAARAAVRRNEFLDLDLAESLAATLLDLLNAAEGYDEHGRRIVQAAVAYFADEDTAEADFDEIAGFEDDRSVIIAAAVTLDRSELVADLTLD